jgi:hypothetical protein
MCTVCYELLQRTREFFDKICEGQRLLSKIINSYQHQRQKISNSNEGKVVLKESSSVLMTVLTFSEDNPVVRAPKRRGRPRRDPLKLVKVKKSTPTDNSLDEGIPTDICTEPRSKRVSRMPARYSDQILTDSSFKLDSYDGEDNKNKSPTSRGSERLSDGGSGSKESTKLGKSNSRSFSKDLDDSVKDKEFEITSDQVIWNFL